MAHEKRRANRRVPVSILIDYETASGSFQFDYTKDLSEGGFFIETTTPQRMGSQIKVKFTLPDTGERLELEGA